MNGRPEDCGGIPEIPDVMQNGELEMAVVPGVKSTSRSPSR
jgi:hypothetical protein